MYLIITQCFASRVGGIENLVTNLALNLSIKNEVVVFADSHLYIQDEIFDSSKKNLLKIFRYGGIKFLRRRKKAHDIKLFLQNKFNTLSQQNKLLYHENMTINQQTKNPTNVGLDGLIIILF